MIYKHFRLQIIFRVALLFITFYLFFTLLFRTGLLATTFIVGALIIFQVFSLIRFVEKTNQHLSRFLEAIRHSDFSQSFSPASLGSSFDQLNAAFSDVIKDFQKARSEKEEHYRYLQTVIQHVGIGLVGFLSDGKVELINTAAKRILRINQLQNIQALKSLSGELVKILFDLNSGKKALIQVQDEDELLQLAIYATEFKMQSKAIKLVSIQNIQSELEEKEFEAWHKLIRVLTHEIMNSVTPISSLASTMNDMLKNYSFEEKIDPNYETVKDVQGAAQTIQRRSEGLLRFVESYRRLTRLPKPNFQIFPIQELFHDIEQLMIGQFKENSIQFSSQINPENLEITADPELIGQILINLLKNSIQALAGKSDPKIELIAKLDDRSRILLQVIDNGVGIIFDVKEKIFIPFFTTKKEGSGIGLSLSKQIMRMHRGTINVQSVPNKRTVFSLRF